MAGFSLLVAYRVEKRVREMYRYGWGESSLPCTFARCTNLHLRPIHFPDHDCAVQRGGGQIALIGRPGQVGDTRGVAARAEGEVGHLNAIFEPGMRILQVPEVDAIIAVIAASQITAIG